MQVKSTQMKLTRPLATLSFYVTAILLFVGAAALASYIQRNFGAVSVSNAWYENETGIPIRAKLYRPNTATVDNRVPGIVYIHGYQNNRETSDPFCIEFGRRGIVALCIDAIGRGNSGIPLPLDHPGFDSSYGAKASLAYLKSLPYVDSSRLGMMGNSIGGEIAYEVALHNPSVKALAFSGFAFDERATGTTPQNMLMVYGKFDEFRDRMTKTRNVKQEWMGSRSVLQAIPVKEPKPGITYGAFSKGTARRVEIPTATHLQIPHSRAAIAVSLEWMKLALAVDPSHWFDPMDQIWHIKEWSTLSALILCLLTVLPLGLLLLRIPLFSSLRHAISFDYVCSKPRFVRYMTINGLFLWLYIPLCAVIFAIHIFVVQIDKVFPMMVVNAIVWWFLVINIIGFMLFVRWIRKPQSDQTLSLFDLGISDDPNRLKLSFVQIAKSFLLGIILFAATYATQHLVENTFIVDLRFIFPYASDLTWNRVSMFPRYYPFLLFGFVQLGLFLHVQLRRPPKKTWLGTWINWSAYNTSALVVPLALFLTIQYIPLLTTGAIPLVGPGGSFVSFILNIFHIIGMLALIIPISTFFFLFTGKPWVGAIFCSAIVTWMLTSSQVIAPIPV